MACVARTMVNLSHQRNESLTSRSTLTTGANAHVVRAQSPSSYRRAPSALRLLTGLSHSPGLRAIDPRLPRSASAPLNCGEWAPASAHRLRCAASGHLARSVLVVVLAFAHSGGERGRRALAAKSSGRQRACRTTASREARIALLGNRGHVGAIAAGLRRAGFGDAQRNLALLMCWMSLSASYRRGIEGGPPRSVSR